MRKRWRLFLVLLLLLLTAGALLVPQVRWPLYGWSRGEAFYEGMPTSYWRKDCERYSVRWYQRGELVGWEYKRDPSWSDRPLGYLGVAPSSSTHPLLNETDTPLMQDSQAIPVLLELLRTGEKQPQLVAAYALRWLHIRAGAPHLQEEQVLAALRDTVPALQEAAQTEDKDVRKEMLETLWTIDPAAAKRTEDSLHRAEYGEPRSVP